MFTEQHYKAIAAIIKHNTLYIDGPHSSFIDGVHSGGKYIAYALADYFADDNPQFNREKFLQACGIYVMADGEI